ncbi:hypothetical protein C8A03DRAFT_39492 [Achaetomium macrosporum]|uniref:Aminoglycoside phosphotransferase domain-containing protein n=1 Tax=Achaetomium macrosporum TaxID=79813 RepID=A0AAN7C1K3_9PEZI|nr:hypothetical protein C8A03DRAFT_39492 [Achaetomium macrosporum]
MFFPGQNWTGLCHFPKESMGCMRQTNWDALRSYASKLNRGMRCELLPDATHGRNYVVRVLEFEDKTRWIVRIQMAKPTTTSAGWLHSEVATMMLVREQTRIHVPRVFGYRFDTNHSIRTAMMLTECVPANAAMDLDGGRETHGGRIPHERRQSFYNQVAKVQLQMTSLRFPKIGVIVRNPDGTYDIGPFPGFGGPFDTAADFFEAWARRAKFNKSDDTIREMMGEFDPGLVEEALKSIRDFPAALGRMAARLSFSNSGPFPLSHENLLHSNILTDEGYNVRSVIDWEGACTRPWELIEFPAFLSAVPPVLEDPWNFDKDAQPLDEETRERWQERAEYVEMVARAEAEAGTDSRLSEVLEDGSAHILAYTLRAYRDASRLLFYTKVLDELDTVEDFDTMD